MVNNDHDLAMALQSHAVDVVIADIADTSALEQPANAAKVPIIAVINKDDSASALTKHFVAVIRMPAKPGKFLDALDRAFESKEMRQDHAKAQPVNSAFLGK